MTSKQFWAGLACLAALLAGLAVCGAQEPGRLPQPQPTPEERIRQLEQRIAEQEAVEANREAASRALLEEMRRNEAGNQAAIALQERVPPPPARVPASELVNPRDTIVKVKVGGYRISAYYNSGEGGNIASEGDEIEVVSPEVDRGIALGREFRDKRDSRMACDVDRLLKKPFTQIHIEERIVTVQQPCPERVPFCCGLGRRSTNCCGITHFGPECGNCAPPAVMAPVASCGFCRGTGCSHCRHHAHGVRVYGAPYGPGPAVGYAGPIMASATMVGGRCAAWTRVTTHLAVYQNPPHGRQFWCDCEAHRQACYRAYGPSVVWELVPCMCGPGCSRCGGSGQCGH